MCAKVFFIPCSNGFRSQNQHCPLNPFGAFLKYCSIAFAILPSIAGGLALYLTRNYEGAIELLTKAAKKGADRRIFNNLALSYCRVGKYDDALQAFLAANDEAAAYNNIGYEYLMNEKYEEAINAFNKAISINPQFYEKAFNNMSSAKKSHEGILKW